MATLEIPKEGLKLVAIIGFSNSSPLWKQAGIITIGKGGKPTILLDKTFNPAGCVTEDNRTSIILTPVPYSKDELQRKEAYNLTSKEPTRREDPFKMVKSRSSSNFDDMDDDIPF